MREMSSTFNWSFDTDDSTLYGNDFGFVVVGNGGIAKLADISQVGDGNATGWGTVTFTTRSRTARCRSASG